MILINRYPNPEENLMYQLMITRFEDDGPTEAKKVGPFLPTLAHALRQVDRVKKHYRNQGYNIRQSGGGRLAARRPTGGVIVAQLVRAGR